MANGCIYSYKKTSFKWISCLLSINAILLFSLSIKIIQRLCVSISIKNKYSKPTTTSKNVNSVYHLNQSLAEKIKVKTITPDNNIACLKATLTSLINIFTLLRMPILYNKPSKVIVPIKAKNKVIKKKTLPKIPASSGFTVCKIIIQAIHANPVPNPINTAYHLKLITIYIIAQQLENRNIKFYNINKKPKYNLPLIKI